MAHVRDLWTSPNPDKNSRKKRIPNKRWGIGKRWQVRWEENGSSVSKTFDYEDAAIEFCARVEVGQADGTWITKAKAELTPRGHLGAVAGHEIQSIGKDPARL